jgi:hypothetical protein
MYVMVLLVVSKPANIKLMTLSTVTGLSTPNTSRRRAKAPLHRGLRIVCMMRSASCCLQQQEHRHVRAGEGRLTTARPSQRLANGSNKNKLLDIGLLASCDTQHRRHQQRRQSQVGVSQWRRRVCAHSGAALAPPLPALASMPPHQDACRQPSTLKLTPHKPPSATRLSSPSPQPPPHHTTPGVTPAHQAPTLTLRSSPGHGVTGIHDTPTAGTSLLC